MKKLLILFLMTIFLIPQSINANATSTVGMWDDGNLRKVDSSGNLLWTTVIPSGQDGILDMDINENTYVANRNSNVYKVDTNGTILWTYTGHTGEVFGIGHDSNFNVYTASFDGTVRKLDSNGNLVWSRSGFTFLRDLKIDSNEDIIVADNNGVYKIDTNNNLLWSTSTPNIALALAVDSNNNIYHVGTGNTLRKYNPSGTLILSFTTPHNDIFGVAVSDNGNIITSGSSQIQTYNSAGTFLWSYTGNGKLTLRVTTDSSNNVHLSGGESLAIRKLDSSGNLLWSYTAPSGLQVYGIAVPPPQPPVIPYPLEVNLDSNYDPFADIIYTRDANITTSSIINDVLVTGSGGFTISTNQSNISPFVFQHWFDLDNNNIFTTNRTFDIPAPDRDYNLRAIYNLTNSIDLSLNSNLPSPPNFNVEVDTIEQERALISKYPLINEEIPFGYNFEVEAPDVSQISFYEFDYWWNNTTNTVFTTSAIISLDALENYDLTATYSLPNEYQIALTLFSNIGDITFKLGNQPAITGSFIQVTVGAMDSWTASGPLNADWQFQNWTDLETNQIFSTNRSIGISNTSKNYILEATYFPIYDVNWDSLGGTPIAPQRIVSGGTINAPSPDPIRPNFAFDGWALPSAPSTPITFPQFATTNVTYQAIWLNTFTLTLNENGGQQVPNQIIIENDTPTVVTPSRFGYTFDGWFTDNLTFNNPFNFNAPFTQSITIHAKWTFGTDRDAGISFDNFLTDAGLNDAFSKWVIVLVAFIILNVIIFIYKGPFIVTTVLNFILTALFIVLGFIPIWIIIIIFIALFGFGILMFTGGRS